jgi:DNA-binding MarR family transcriptional regulator
MENIDQQALLALRQNNIGRMFQRAARAYSDVALIKLRDYGHDGLTLFHTALISNLDLEGNRITTLAQRAGVSKQAMGQLVGDLEQRGYIERIPDPNDGRATLIKFTEQGWQLLQDAYLVKLAIETEYTEILGEAGMKELWRLLKGLIKSAD